MTKRDEGDGEGNLCNEFVFGVEWFKYMKEDGNVPEIYCRLYWLLVGMK